MEIYNIMEKKWIFNPSDPDDRYRLKLYGQAQGMLDSLRDLVGGYAQNSPSALNLRAKLKYEELDESTSQFYHQLRAQIFEILSDNQVDIDLDVDSELY